MNNKQLIEINPIHKKLIWVNRYFKRIEYLFDIVHKKWLDESIINYGSHQHHILTELKNKIYFKMKVLVRYSSILTSKSLIILNENN